MKITQGFRNTGIELKGEWKAGLERAQAEGSVCNRRREKGDTVAPQAVIQLERVRGEGYRIVQCS